MPLSTLRVLDLSRLLPGPYCTQILADFGAEVVKVEDAELGDYARHVGQLIDGNSLLFHQINRNKKSIIMNLKDSKEKKQFINLVKKADILVESFRPGVMERLGLDYDYLKTINPKLIYCAITGYGQTGPYKHKAGHDLNYISEAGLLNLSGNQNEKPALPATQIADIAGGAMPATIGILLALIHRQKTNEGQFVDISMTDGALSMMPILLSEYLTSKELFNRGEQTLTGKNANYAVYQTKDKRYLSVGAVELKFWRNFCETIGREDFIEKINAPQNIQDVMKDDIQHIIEKKTLKEWLHDFSNQEACVSGALTFDEVLNHPQFEARQMFTHLKSENKSKLPFKQIGIPIKLQQSPGQIKSGAPQLGAHTEEVLHKWLGVEK